MAENKKLNELEAREHRLKARKAELLYARRECIEAVRKLHENEQVCEFFADLGEEKGLLYELTHSIPTGEGMVTSLAFVEGIVATLSTLNGKDYSRTNRVMLVWAAGAAKELERNLDEIGDITYFLDAVEKEIEGARR